MVLRGDAVQQLCVSAIRLVVLLLPLPLLQHVRHRRRDADRVASALQLCRRALALTCVLLRVPLLRLP